MCPRDFVESGLCSLFEAERQSSTGKLWVLRAVKGSFFSEEPHAPKDQQSAPAHPAPFRIAQKGRDDRSLISCALGTRFAEQDGLD